MDAVEVGRACDDLGFLWYEDPYRDVRPEFMVRFRWKPGCVAFWDNRSTAHLAPRDIFETEFDRQFWRVTLMGEAPVGVDGRLSNLIEGRPITPV